MATQVTITGIDEVMTSLQNISSRKMDKDVKAIIRYVLREAQKKMKSDARMELQSDPRRAYLAVRYAVYKSLLGGNVNILARRHNNGKMTTYQPPHKLHPGQRGGNRMERSRRTDEVDSYYGTDRGFILRFVNAGTNERYAGTRSRSMRPAKRGRITGGNWFGISSKAALDIAAGQLQDLIEEAIQKVWNNGEK